MPSASHDGCTLVTGASGHIGRAVTAGLRDSGRNFLATDIGPLADGLIACDLRLGEQVAKLFEIKPIQNVIHLAGILPSAFHEDLLGGAALNLTGSLHLLREAVTHKVKRFIFASSVSVYGLTGASPRPFTEDDPPAPDEPYGASKLAIEVLGEALSRTGAIEFVALRIARVIGPGIKKTSSPWRAQMFESASVCKSIAIPFSPDAELSLLHVEDAARMLILLAETTALGSCIYNSPVDIFTAHQLKELIEQARGIRVELGREGAYAGATCDGSRFAQEFGFQLRGVRERLLQKTPL